MLGTWLPEPKSKRCTPNFPTRAAVQLFAQTKSLKGTVVQVEVHPMCQRRWLLLGPIRMYLLVWITYFDGSRDLLATS
jgi:hypothetical protein